MKRNKKDNFVMESDYSWREIGGDGERPKGVWMVLTLSIAIILCLAFLAITLR